MPIQTNAVQFDVELSDIIGSEKQSPLKCDSEEPNFERERKSVGQDLGPPLPWIKASLARRLAPPLPGAEASPPRRDWEAEHAPRPVVARQRPSSLPPPSLPPALHTLAVHTKPLRHCQQWE